MLTRPLTRISALLGTSWSVGRGEAQGSGQAGAGRADVEQHLLLATLHGRGGLRFVGRATFTVTFVCVASGLRPAEMGAAPTVATIAQQIGGMDRFAEPSWHSGFPGPTPGDLLG